MFWQNNKNSIFWRVSCDSRFSQEMALKERNPTILRSRRNKIVKIITVMVPSKGLSRIKPLSVLLKWGIQWTHSTLLSRESNTYAVICTVNSLLMDISLKRAPSLARALVPAFIYSWVSPPRRSSSNLVPRSPTAKGKGQDRVRSGYEINILRLRPWLSNACPKKVYNTQKKNQW